MCIGESNSIMLGFGQNLKHGQYTVWNLFFSFFLSFFLIVLRLEKLLQVLSMEEGFLFVLARQ
jgi:hypothetical protein